MHHENKIALVTGSSRGLGRAIALKLAADGADVVITYHQQREAGEAVCAEIESLGGRAALLPLDVGDADGFVHFSGLLEKTLRDTFETDRFDFLVNNAGNLVTKPFVETTPEDFDRMMQVHFKGVYFLTQTLLPLLNDGGRIVNTSTGLTRFSTPGFSAYAAMKGAIEVFTRYLAKELGPRRIAVNTVAPGVMETDFTRHHLARAEARTFLANSTALGRIGQSIDIGGVVSFLCSDEGRWLDAQRIEASGGMFL